MRARGPLAALLLLVAFGTTPTAQAHPLAPALLELVERGDGRVTMAWRRPVKTLPGVTRRPVLPEACTHVETLQPEITPLHLTDHVVLDCGATLVGQRVAVAGLAEGGTDALLRVSLADGRSFQRVLRGDAPEALIPAAPSALTVARDYATLGVEHILTGPDHLLFVLGLVLLVSGLGALVCTISAFTVGHSVTLGLATLGLVRVPSAAIEVLIAASVFWLAVELARGAGTGRPSRMRRLPWAMAGGFGLLHGLGFAGALTEAGLPGGEIPLALFSFNVGIELGQLGFVSMAVLARLALAGAELRARPLPGWASYVPVYAMGSVSALWVLERALGVGP